MKVAMKVSDVMTKRVIAVSPETTILDAIQTMLKKHISGMPVIDDKGDLVGIISEGDFLRRPEIGTERKRSRWLDAFLGSDKPARDYVHAHGRKVQDVMTPRPVAVREDTPLDEVVHLMESRNIKRVPVVHRNKVVGIVSRANLMRALPSIHRATRKTTPDDIAIRDRILADIGRQTWSADANVDVVVRDGIVDLWGAITEEAQRQALRVLVENVPGVKRLEDHVTWRSDLISPS